MCGATRACAGPFPPEKSKAQHLFCVDSPIGAALSTAYNPKTCKHLAATPTVLLETFYAYTPRRDAQ